jgi:F0F1-type ATP synthase assembly protein I
MAEVCTMQNPWVNMGLTVGVQSLFMFIFLTVFFFAYVTKVEKQQFKKQLDFVVDEVVGTIVDDAKKFVPPGFQKEKKELEHVVNNYIDNLQKEESKKTSQSLKEINENNSKVKKKGVQSIIIISSIIIAITLIFFIIGYCLPLQRRAGEGFIILIFVALTEFTFLEVVAKNYSSVDPNKIRRDMANAIINYKP